MFPLARFFRSLFVFCALGCTVAHAQVSKAPRTACSSSSKLSCLLPDLYGPTGLTLENPFHEPHFNSAFQDNFRTLNAAVANELTHLPFASPASGFTFVFDSISGVFTRSAQSFGPVLTERAETIGRGKLYLGFTYQRFSFNSLDGIDLGNVPVVFTHKAGTGPAANPDPPYEKDFLTSKNSIDLRVNQFTVFGTVGITNRIDLAVAVPILDVNVNASSAVTIHRTAPPNPAFCGATPNCTGQFHYFDKNDQNGSIFKTYPGSGTASGVGDAVLRVKGTVKRWESSSFAIAADIRTPTGDSHDFLGAGAFGFRPFLAYSTGLGRLAPHFNVGYEINGSSLLAGNTFTMNPTKGHLPNQFTYSAGTDIGLKRSLTIAFDLIGARVFNAPRVFPSTYTAQVPELSTGRIGAYPSTRFATGSFMMDSGSAGLKWNVYDRLLVTGNVLFRVDNGGLRANFVPLIGASYIFR